VSIGDVSLSRGCSRSGGTGSSPTLPDKAFDILADVALLPVQPWTWG
jgi:hypothetical protein